VLGLKAKRPGVGGCFGFGSFFFMVFGSLS
jgi:hypothetical protein